MILKCDNCKLFFNCDVYQDFCNKCHLCSGFRPKVTPNKDKHEIGCVEKINHPNHYNWHPSGIECKTIVQEFPYNLGTAIAYIWRSEHKCTFKSDIKKAIKHLEMELERKEKND